MCDVCESLMLRVELKRKLRDFVLDVAFEVAADRALALIGPTGCGKTMTLRMIAGLEPPDAGRIAVAEQVLFDAATGRSLPPHRRRVGLVFQHYALFPHMTVLQNVMYGLQARGQRGARVRAAAMEALERVRLQTLAHEFPRRLSGGQQQRVALARALVVEPEVLLLDEPISALDAQTRNHVRGELRRFIESVGIPTVLVTHDHVDALTLAEDICVMQDGRIVQSGGRQELLSRPTSEFVADFLGLNMIRGEATRAADGTVEIRTEAGAFYTVEDVSGPVFLTFHPSDVTVSLDPPHGSALNVVRGEITGLVHLGGGVRVTVTNEATIVAEVSARSALEMGLEAGSAVYAHFKASAARCYA